MAIPLFLKIALSFFAIILTFFSYFYYIKDILAGKTKPHAYSWLVWAILTAIAFFGQLFDGGGAGSWVTGATAIGCVFIFVLALRQGEKDITRTDTLSLVASFVALLLWGITNNPLGSIILVTIVDALGFYPTFRKSYHKPHEETMASYVLATIKFGISIIALQRYSVITVLYPASLVLMNAVFVLMLLVQRKNKRKVLNEHVL